MLNKVDQAKLVIEITKPAYAGKNDGECEVIFSELSTVYGSRKTPVRNIHKYMIATGIWAGLKAAAPTNTTADGVLDIIGSNNFTEIDLLDPVSEAMLSTLVGDALLSSLQKTDLQDMSRVLLDKGEVLIGQGKTIHHLDIAHARGRGN